MRVDRAIAAMRRDRTLLQRAQAIACTAARRWREDARIAPILAELEEYGRGAPLSSCPALGALFETGPGARDFAERFCAAQSAALVTRPLGELWRSDLDLGGIPLTGEVLWMAAALGVMALALAVTRAVEEF